MCKPSPARLKKFAELEARNPLSSVEIPRLHAIISVPAVSSSENRPMDRSSLKSKTIVGLEIHVQLATRTKLFCGCPVEFGAPPNTHVCPVCLGHPGVLPVLNRRALEYALRAGLALGCSIAEFTKWDRKGYYYPDLPKNYQISQYDLPLAREGMFEFPVGPESKKVRIRRAHLEEDAGKNLHDLPECTLVDLNRAGTPLLEIVTEPDIHSPQEAYAFCTELQRLMVYIGVSEGVMQKGQMRFEPNVNVAIEFDGKEYRTPIAEVKNLNSFRAVRGAIAYEEERQIQAWLADNDYQLGLRPNENRGWLDEKSVTEFQRIKEEAQDYRYFPDPDLVPVVINEHMLEDIRKSLPELPIARRRRLTEQLGLSPKDAATIVSDRATADLFDRVVAAGAPPDVAARQFVNIWLKLANKRKVAVAELGVTPKHLAGLAGIVQSGSVSNTAADRIAQAMLERPESPEQLAKEMNLLQIQDRELTAAWVDQVFVAQQAAVEEAKTNPRKSKAIAGFLRGQVMRLSKGKADPRLVGRLIDERLMDQEGT
jgi:aspartyl-tRNA(Asn)/glutamyl-tRNA(Gln) amidotransferase subunit B